MSARPAESTQQLSRTARPAVIETLKSRAARQTGLDLLVLFGSVARGEDHHASDVDLLIEGPITRDHSAMSRLRGELVEALGRPVGVLTLNEARELAPLLTSALRDGVVIADRSDQWASLLRMRACIERDASAEIGTYPSRRAAALARLGSDGRA